MRSLMKVRNPRTGTEDYEIDPMRPLALAALARRLKQAQPRWAARPPEERAGLLHALADGIEAGAEALTQALAVDTGRHRISRIEVEGAAAMLRRWAGRAPALLSDLRGEARPSAIPGISLSSALHPYPLVGVVSPWNFPLTLALIDAVPALAAGCAAIVKPSEVTPRFAAPLRDIVAGVPEIAEVLSIIDGNDETGAALVKLSDFICFTGSVTTGRKVAVAAAEAMIPASLELGGKDPMIVLASADPAWAAGVALRAGVVNTGQACQSIERIYVAEAIAPAFVAELRERAEAVRLNDGVVGEGELGPFILARQAEIVQAQIDDAVAKGAELLTGGAVEERGGGLYLRPTILTGVTHEMDVMREETFGPVLPVMSFADEEGAVRLANEGDFGLSAAVLANMAEEAERVAVQLKAGAVSINDGALTSMVWDAEKTSFGSSGLGPTRMGDAGLSRFLRRQALIRQEGQALPLSAFAEDAA